MESTDEQKPGNENCYRLPSGENVPGLVKENIEMRGERNSLKSKFLLNNI
jgi:hypothetical protein